MREMLPHLISHPPHIDIPKYIPEYPSHTLSRPKLAPSPPFFADISHLVSSSVSPAQSDSPADTVDDDIQSPHSPRGSSGNYHYDHRGSGSFDSPVSPAEMYENDPPTASYSTPSHSYRSASAAQANYDLINQASLMRASGAVTSYLSDSPSPVDATEHSSFHHTINSLPPQERLLHNVSPSYQAVSDRFGAPSDPMSGRYSRNNVVDKYSGSTNTHSQNAILDHRRMSEPAVLGTTNPYAPPSSCDTGTVGRLQAFDFNSPPLSVSRPSASAYMPSLQRGVSMGSLRDSRHSQFGYSSQAQPHYSGWKEDGESHHQHHRESFQDDDGLDGSMSPLQPDFTGGGDSPASGLQYSPIASNPYGPSPPGTGTSTTSSIAPLGVAIPHASVSHSGGDGGHSPRGGNNKTYSFVALPGNAVKKRPRRRYDEIERLYRCSWPDCSKAYGTLNHLNAHVTMQKHGAKRSPNEFKELRKQWRKAKKDSVSPVSRPMRRASTNLRHGGGHDIYDPRRYDLNGSNQQQSPSLYHRQISHHSSGGLAMSVPVLHAGSGERYPIPVEDIRYPVDERDDDLAAYAASARQRYSGSTPASWHGGMTSSRASAHHYMSTSLPGHTHPSHSHLPHPSTQPQHSQMESQQRSRPTSSHAAMNRLPPDSTLLTPLPGYNPPSLLPPLHIGSGDLSYASEGYDMYEEESNGRPGTGHASLGRGSGDEY